MPTNPHQRHDHHLPTYGSTVARRSSVAAMPCTVHRTAWFRAADRTQAKGGQRPRGHRTG
jgi:hypothetical protein